MYAVLQIYRLNSGDSAELQHQMAHDWVPLLRQMPGFVAYYWLDSGSDIGVSFCTFEDQASAAAVLAQAANRGLAAITQLVGSAEMLCGAVTVYANAGL